MTDKAYREFIQTRPSCLGGGFSEWIIEIGEWRNPACHVRRAGRSGTAYKEPYATIPMTHEEHAYQHRHGELACLVKYTRDPQLKATLLNAPPAIAERLAGEWFDAQRNKYRDLWRKRTNSAPWEEMEFVNG